jgi:hypothetical protein
MRSYAVRRGLLRGRFLRSPRSFPTQSISTNRVCAQRTMRGSRGRLILVLPWDDGPLGSSQDDSTASCGCALDVSLQEKAALGTARKLLLRRFSEAITERDAVGARAIERIRRHSQMSTLSAEVPSLRSSMPNHCLRDAAFEAIGTAGNGRSWPVRLFSSGHASRRFSYRPTSETGLMSMVCICSGLKTESWSRLIPSLRR